MYTKKQVAELLQSFMEELEENSFPSEKLLLFGSYTNGGVHNYSDVDIAVWGK